ncbi:putative phage abortive infection protein [Aliarcobacter butzleri]|uniref:putative phage abortive infection protein n=1 Tax=Aliarcobacter butzleri TaxID=28197 RepID=UPI001EDBF9A1|nr:putative phage abortive infection protein [Aliarcobacter butzleri]MCG3675602.1 putative phage abortive infection protein [Aliarcobacter butzleri]
MEENKKDLDFLDRTYSKISNALNDEEKTRRSLFSIFIIALIIIASIFLIELILVICFSDIDKLGAFGDFFGGMINPLLTFCTFMALLMTIILQQKELSLTREELSETKKATKDSAQALREQSNSLKIQNFETTFFSMINLHNQIINNVDLLKLRNPAGHEPAQKLKLTDKEINGELQATKTKASPEKYYYTILDEKVDIEEDNDYNGKKAILKLFEICNAYIKQKESKNIKELYDNFYKEYNVIIGHYFRNFYQILKFVNKKYKNKYKKQKFYTNILRAQLSNAELGLLLINAISDHGSKELLPLLIKFQFMEPLPFSIFDDSYRKLIIELSIKKDEEKELFGDNKEWIKYITELNTFSQEQQ